MCFNSNGSIILEVLIICDSRFRSVRSLRLRSITGLHRSDTTGSRFTTPFMVILDHLYLKVQAHEVAVARSDVSACWSAAFPPHPGTSGSAGPSHSSQETTIVKVNGGEVVSGSKLGNTFIKAPPYTSKNGKN